MKAVARFRKSSFCKWRSGSVNLLERARSWYRTASASRTASSAACSASVSLSASSSTPGIGASSGAIPSPSSSSPELELESSELPDSESDESFPLSLPFHSALSLSRNEQVRDEQLV